MLAAVWAHAVDMEGNPPRHKILQDARLESAPHANRVAADVVVVLQACVLLTAVLALVVALI